MLSSRVAPELTVGVAELAAAAGCSRLWLTEDYYRKAGFSSCGAALAATTSLPVGLGVVSLYLRHPSTLAMEIATLERMYGPRFDIGLGLGSPRALRGSDRLPARAIGSVRDRVRALRELLEGRSVTWQDEFDRLTDTQLEHPPTVAPRLWLAAEGPQMLALAREHADGVVFSAFSTLEYVQWARSIIDTEGPHPTVLYQHLSVDEDRAAATETATATLVARLRAGFPSSSLRRSGWWPQLEPLLGASTETITAALTEEIVGSFVVFGDPEECRQKLAEIAPHVEEVALAPALDLGPTGAEGALRTLQAIAPTLT